MSKRIFILGSVVTLGILVLVSSVAFADEDPPPPDNPVVQFLAALTDEGFVQTWELHGEGYSLGNVAREYMFDSTGCESQDSLSQAQGKGWGVLSKQAGCEPGGGGRGLGWLLGKAVGRPDHAGGGKPEGVGQPPAWAGGPGGNPNDPDEETDGD